MAPRARSLLSLLVLLLMPGPSFGEVAGYWAGYTSSDCGTGGQVVYELPPNACIFVENIYIRATCTSEHDSRGSFATFSDASCTQAAYGPHPTRCSASTFDTPSDACNNWVSGTRLTPSDPGYIEPSCFKWGSASHSFEFWCTRPHYHTETTATYGLKSLHAFYTPFEAGGGQWRNYILMTPPARALGDHMAAVVIGLSGRGSTAESNCHMMANPYVTAMNAIVVCPQGLWANGDNGNYWLGAGWGWNFNTPGTTEGIAVDDTVFIGLCLQNALRLFQVPETRSYAIGYVSCCMVRTPIGSERNRVRARASPANRARASPADTL
jgi:hypothetical protein